MKRVLRTALMLSAASCLYASVLRADVVINEVFYDSPGTDLDCWLELKGDPGTSLDAYTVVGVNGNGGPDYQPIPLTGQVIPVDGYFVIAQRATSVPSPEMVHANVNYQNGPDSIQLRKTVSGNPVLVDAIGYGTFTGSDVFAGEGSPAPAQAPPATLARCPDGFDSNNNVADFVIDTTPTPGTANDATCGTPIPQNKTVCEIAADNVDGVPVLNTVYVRTEGICVVPSGTYSPTVQEFTITDGDCCVAVFGGAVSPVVNIGDRVRVEGTVAHFNGRTEITSPFLSVSILSSGNPIPTPADVTTFDLSVNGENYESCLIRLTCVNITAGTWPAAGQNSNLTVDDGTGPVTLRVDLDTDIDGTPAPSGPFTVIGMGSQFDTSSPYSGEYQIIPRRLSDFDFDACAPAEGACCLRSGACLIDTPSGCAQRPGAVYQGDGTTCDPNPCPQPVGACCFADGHCEEITGADCGAAGGNYEGNFTLCDPNPCPQPTGACCYADGSCLIQLRSDCKAGGGTYQGDFTSCDPNPCEQPTGACCHGDGSCEITTALDCEQTGGTYLGNFTGCDPNPCPQPPGACCFVDGCVSTCTSLTEEDCAAQGGSFQGDGTACDPFPCPVVSCPGACCLADGTCVVTTADDCASQQGDYQGDGTVCGPDLCAPVPTRKSTWGQIKRDHR